MFVEEIYEEEVDAEFPSNFCVVSDNRPALSDTSRLLSHNPDLFKYFLFRHLR